MHVHASNVKLDEKGSAKFYIKSNGDSIVTKKGKLSDIEINKISRFIKVHYKEMYLLWSTESEKGFYYSSK